MKDFEFSYTLGDVVVVLMIIWVVYLLCLVQ